MECPVCYASKVSCMLVCGHTFCMSCVKTWYNKSECPSCPMCRRAMYFKGMSKLVEKWEAERTEKKNEDAFNQAFDEIFDDSESDSDDGYDSQEDEDPYYQYYYSKFMLEEIVQLQKDYQKALELGVDFEWYMENIDYFEIEYEPRVMMYDDVFPHQKNLFVSKYSGALRNNQRGRFTV